MAFAMSFSEVRAVTTAPNGTEDDTADVNATDYLLELVGNWREI